MNRVIYNIEEYNQLFYDVRNKRIRSLTLSSINVGLERCTGDWDRRGSNGSFFELKEMNGNLYFPRLNFPKRLVDLEEFIATGVNGIDLAFLGSKLKVLYLNDCLLDNPEGIQFFPHLTRLEIAQLPNELPKDFDYGLLKALKVLNLSFQVEKQIDLTGCTSLETVRLTRVRFDSADWLPTENLRVIELIRCTCPDSTVLNLRDCPKLRRVELQSTKVGTLITGRMVRNDDRDTKPMGICTEAPDKLILGDLTILRIEGPLMPEIICDGGSLVGLTSNVREMRGTELDMSEHLLLESLDIQGLAGCKAITGLEYCHRLSMLWIFGCKEIERISPLDGLDNLWTINFSECSVLSVPDLPASARQITVCLVLLTDLTFMRKSRVKDLEIMYCGLESLNGLSCKDLAEAVFTNNNLTSVECLTLATKLKRLTLCGNPIVDVDCLRGRGMNIIFQDDLDAELEAALQAPQ